MDINLINDARLEINSDFRKAIIDSSCAVENTLTRECQKKLRQMTNEGFSKSILDDKYKTLGNRLYLALLLGILVDDNYSKDIVSLRNKVIHEGYNPKLEETQLALKKCQKIVKQFSALKYFR